MNRTRPEVARESRSRPFGFGTELRRQATRARTRWALGVAAGLPIVILLAFLLGPDTSGGGLSQLSDLTGLATEGGLNFAVFVFFLSGWFLLATVVAIFFGDTVAGEVSWGTLRYLLVIPVARGRLLGIKFAVAAFCSMTAVFLLMGVALVVGTLAYGWHPLRSSISGELQSGPSLIRLLGVVAYACATLLVVAGVAFAISVSTDAALGAVGGAVVVHIVSSILDQIQALGPVRVLLPTHYNDAWLGLLSNPAQTLGMARGTALALVYAAIAFGVAWFRFLRVDFAD